MATADGGEDTSSFNFGQGGIYEVDKIVDVKKKKNGTLLFRVRWDGFGADDDTWEPRENLLTCDGIVVDFITRNPQLYDLLSIAFPSQVQAVRAAAGTKDVTTKSSLPPPAKKKTGQRLKPTAIAVDSTPTESAPKRKYVRKAKPKEKQQTGKSAGGPGKVSLGAMDVPLPVKRKRQYIPPEDSSDGSEHAENKPGPASKKARLEGPNDDHSEDENAFLSGKNQREFGDRSLFDTEADGPSAKEGKKSSSAGSLSSPTRSLSGRIFSDNESGEASPCAPLPANPVGGTAVSRSAFQALSSSLSSSIAEPWAKKPSDKVRPVPVSTTVEPTAVSTAVSSTKAHVRQPNVVAGAAKVATASSFASAVTAATTKAASQKLSPGVASASASRPQLSAQPLSAKPASAMTSTAHPTPSAPLSAYPEATQISTSRPTSSALQSAKLEAAMTSALRPKPAVPITKPWAAKSSPAHPLSSVPSPTKPAPAARSSALQTHAAATDALALQTPTCTSPAPASGAAGASSTTTTTAATTASGTGTAYSSRTGTPGISTSALMQADDGPLWKPPRLISSSQAKPQAQKTQLAGVSSKGEASSSKMSNVTSLTPPPLEQAPKIQRTGMSSAVKIANTKAWVQMQSEHGPPAGHLLGGAPDDSVGIVPAAAATADDRLPAPSHYALSSSQVGQDAAPVAANRSTSGAQSTAASASVTSAPGRPDQHRSVSRYEHKAAVAASPAEQTAQTANAISEHQQDYGDMDSDRDEDKLTLNLSDSSDNSLDLPFGVNMDSKDADAGIADMPPLLASAQQRQPSEAVASLLAPAPALAVSTAPAATGGVSSKVASSMPAASAAAAGGGGRDPVPTGLQKPATSSTQAVETEFDFDDASSDEEDMFEAHVVPAVGSATVEKVIPYNMMKEAVKTSNTAVIEQALRSGFDMELTEGMQGVTLLMIAASARQDPSVRMLLASGAQVNVAQRNGLTALMIAADQGFASICDMLIKAGAYLNVQQNNGETALMKAARRGSVEVVELLVRAGVNTIVTSQVSLTAAEYATKHRHEGVCNTIRSYYTSVTTQVRTFIANVLSHNGLGTMRLPIKPLHCISPGEASEVHLPFTFQPQENQSVNVRLFLVRLHASSARFELSWLSSSSSCTSDVYLNNQHVTPMAISNKPISIYQLWPQRGSNRLRLQLTGTLPSSPRNKQQDIVCACIYNTSNST
eukprot:scpid41570/ scgid31790/ M-phase phosphoprotein 8; Two hybrid-associated protein 3 with RanBPM